MGETLAVAAGLVIFFAVLAKFGVPGKMMDALDARGRRIAAELAEAKRLREEAEKLLASFEGKRKEAEAEARQIVAAAKAEADRMTKENEARLADFVTRRTAAAEQKIAQAEAQAANEVRAAAAEVAASAAEKVLRGAMEGAGGDKLLADSLKEARAKLN